MRDMECGMRSLTASRSFSIRAVTSFSLDETSTGLAAPKGLALATGTAGLILGDERGDGLVEFPDRGNSSSFRRPS